MSFLEDMAGKEVSSMLAEQLESARCHQSCR